MNINENIHWFAMGYIGIGMILLSILCAHRTRKGEKVHPMDEESLILFLWPLLLLVVFVAAPAWIAVKATRAAMR